MTIIPVQPGEPRRPDGPRDPGDAWVVAESGERYWGRFGAAGVLAFDPERGVLLQHRVGWSHFGGTWGIPGGALHEGESARDGALREAQEEAGIPDGALKARFASVLDLRIWSYTTVVADVVSSFEPVIRNLSYLYRHVEINGLENVRILPFAVSSSADMVTFSSGPNSAMGSLDLSGNSGDMLVQTVTLDDICERLQLRPDVMKMDVEGAEMEVFRGGEKTLATVRPKIFLSTHSPELRTECLDLLGSLGYTIEPLMKGDDPHEFFARP